MREVFRRAMCWTILFRADFNSIVVFVIFLFVDDALCCIVFLLIGWNQWIWLKSILIPSVQFALKWKPVFRSIHCNFTHTIDAFVLKNTTLQCCTFQPLYQYWMNIERLLNAVCNMFHLFSALEVMNEFERVLNEILIYFALFVQSCYLIAGSWGRRSWEQEAAPGFVWLTHSPPPLPI